MKISSLLLVLVSSIALYLGSFSHADDPTSAANPSGPLTTIPVDNPTPKKYGWDKECADRVAAAQGKPIDLIFIGDSVTQNFVEFPKNGWTSVGGTVWAKHYADKNALNFGVGSDGTQHILYRMDHMDIKSFTPKVVIIESGLNNLKESSSDDILAGLKAIVAKSEAFYPNAKIVVMGITPSNRDKVKTAAVNQALASYVDNQKTFFLDLTPFMPPVGDNYQGIGKDKTHLTPEGYEIWASQLDPLLTKLMTP